MADSASTSVRKSAEDSRKTPKRPISKEHTFKKRQPRKPEEGRNVIYVSTKTNTKVMRWRDVVLRLGLCLVLQNLLDECGKLVRDGENELILYCMGAAIQRGILLALQFCEKHVAFQIDAKTFTTELLGWCFVLCNETKE